MNDAMTPDPNVAAITPEETRESWLEPDQQGLVEEDRFPGLADMLEDFLTPQLALDIDPAQPDQLLGLYVERLALDLPIELQPRRDEHGVLTVGVAPPTQWIETSVQPVLHRLRVTLELNDDDDA
ncbi:hypothetical protein EUZ85_15545 [Hahella sp. KA22]|uniref:hypothetical protein n=1 Tax=Hahella sp. KA22 TaxID=1628392 RepID=UPI000FDE173B|nr:hypothetical protein [Hahella sp. KA22]AZZ92062.1 hypothetical protein ENC22_12980 [Hahella sp. KA22]QAY55433.1 hypothetical protein EUZ85_15545 [Hahella sp. KA22]